MVRRALFVAALVCLAPLPLRAQEDARQRALEQLARALELPVELLDAVGAERRLAADPRERRALLHEVGRRRDPRLLPLLIDAAEREQDPQARMGAIHLLSVVGLEADRDLYLERLLPALVRLLDDPSEPVFLAAADELVLLEGWFQRDAEVAPVLDAAFHGKRLRLAQQLFPGLLQLSDPELTEGLVQQALVEVLERRSRFGVFERKRAVLESAGRGGPLDLAGYIRLVTEGDGTLAVEAVEVLGALRDPAALPALRRIDRTAAHALRIPALLARGRIGDEQLLALVGPTFTSDHPDIQRALVQALGSLPRSWVEDVLRALAARVTDPGLRREVALARLATGDDADAPLLAEGLAADPVDPELAGAIAATPGAAALPLVMQVARATGEDLGPARALAIDRLGDEDVRTAEARELLRGLAARGSAALRVRAAVSLMLLDDPGADRALERAAGALRDGVEHEDLWTEVGRVRRLADSPLFEPLERLVAADELEAAPLLAGWLDPPPKRGEQESPGPRPWLANQFVRRATVDALGELAWGLAVALEELELAGEDEDPDATRTEEAPAEGPEPELLATWYERALEALVRCLDDRAGVVRTAAIRALAPLAGHELARGASLEAEAEALTAVREWLAEREE